MNFKEAILKLQISDSEIAEVIANHVAALNEESAGRRIELRDSLAVIEKLKKVVGDEDLLDFVSSAKKKAGETESSTADAQSKLEAALIESEVANRSYKLLKAATLSGADEKALNELLKGVSTDKIAIDADVKIDGKPLKDFAVSQADFWERALFPAAQNSVPTGGKSSATETINPGMNYANSQAQQILQRLGKTV